MSGLELMQVALNTCDMAGSLRFYSEVFGFTNAGATAIWGDSVRIQGLKPADRAVAWWMVGRQSTFQMELFQHTNPPQRPLPSDWSPADHGWTRFGIGVPDFEKTLAALEPWEIAPISPPHSGRYGRCAAIRDPFSGAVIEIIEESDAMAPDLRKRSFDFDPFVVYAALSVPDIHEARRFYSEVIGLPILGENNLHGLEHEALWGLEGAHRETFLAQVGDGLLEIVEYKSPRGRPVPADYRITDQGIMNVGLRTTNKAELAPVLDRLIACGATLPCIAHGESLLGTYVRGNGRELELLGWPREMDAAFGLAPATPLLGATVGKNDLLMLSVEEYRQQALTTATP
jgi:catechol 2,3-dioxygenase-like lactoylglutathione lyase family enzyme